MERLLVLALVACGSSQDPAPVSNTAAPPLPGDAAPAAGPRSFEAALAKITGFRDDMCKCTDKACAERVTEAYTNWGMAMAHEAEDNAKAMHPTEAQIQYMTQLATEYVDCSMKATGSVNPPLP